MSRLFLGLMLVVGFAAQSRAGLVYSEDFEDGVADGITVIYPTFQIGSGLRGSNFGFHSPNPPSNGQIFRLDNVTSDNVRIEVDSVIGNASFGDFEIGINAVVDDPVTRGPSGYWATIHPAGSDSTDALLKMSYDGGMNVGTAFERKPGIISANSVNRLVVNRFGSSIDVLLNGDPYMSAVDDTYHGGSIFFRIFGPGTIDNISVTAVPEPSTLLAGLVGGGICGLVYLKRRRDLS